uniref:Transmembrane protein n=1 Tax=Heterorhabditis bacteriophora TaxID=37862 RepID=A0A1I7WPX3_HETBA
MKKELDHQYLIMTRVSNAESCMIIILVRVFLLLLISVRLITASTSQVLADVHHSEVGGSREQLVDTDEILFNSSIVTDDDADTSNLSQSLKNKLKGFFTKSSKSPEIYLFIYLFLSKILLFQILRRIDETVSFSKCILCRNRELDNDDGAVETLDSRKKRRRSRRKRDGESSLSISTDVLVVDHNEERFRDPFESHSDVIQPAEQRLGDR